MNVNQNRILGEIEDQVQQILALLFENYKSLDELSPSGLIDVFGPPTGLAAPALASAVKLYNLLHDILGSESQLKLTRYFQVPPTISVLVVFFFFFLIFRILPTANGDTGCREEEIKKALGRNR